MLSLLTLLNQKKQTNRKQKTKQNKTKHHGCLQIYIECPLPPRNKIPLVLAFFPLFFFFFKWGLSCVLHFHLLLLHHWTLGAELLPFLTTIRGNKSVILFSFTRFCPLETARLAACQTSAITAFLSWNQWTILHFLQKTRKFVSYQLDIRCFAALMVIFLHTTLCKNITIRVAKWQASMNAA